MTAEAHYIPGIDPGSGMVGAPGCSMIRYFKAATTAEMNAIADELDGDMCYVLAIDALYISVNGVWSQMAGAGGVPALAFGTRAARPVPAAAGLQYFAYDQAATYVDSGSAWVRVSTAAGITGHSDGTLAPIGWVLRDGTSYDKTDPLYTDLFNAIGYTHGGSGNNFNVSDARGRASVARSAADTEFDVVGEKFGEKAHVNTLAETASHDHGPGTLRHLNPTRQGIAGSNQWVYVFDNWDNVTQVSFPLAATGATGLAGGNAAHNNIQPSIVGLGIVKL